MRLFKDLLFAVVGVAAGVAVLALMPIYGAPFVGCEATGFRTVVPGCSLWPDYFTGLLMAFVVAVAVPARLRPAFWGLALVSFAAALGGPAAIKSGAHLEFFHAREMAPYWRGSGLALLLGGVSGLALTSGIARALRSIRDRRREESSRGDG